MPVNWRRTRQAVRLLAGLIDTRLRARPLLLSHLVTCRCPCRCETCLWRDLVREELSADDSVDGSPSDLTRRALALLKTDFQPTTWQAFWQTTVENCPAPEVAKELQMSVAAVWKAKSRVMQRLREELSGLDDD